MNTHARIDLGKFGEDFACRYLQSKGYMILCRNYKTRYAEIDIIAKKNDAISFIEVKTRKSLRYGRPLEAVTLVKQRKIYRCAEYYLQSAGLLNCMPMLSFDVVEVIIESNAVVKLNHYPHCF